MKAIVVYYSRTGNTRKIASAIAEEIEAKLTRAEDAGDVGTFDLICVGTPVYGGGPAGPIKRYLYNLPELKGKRVVCFCTRAIMGGRRTIRFMKNALEAKDAEFIGGFISRASSGILFGFGPKLWARSRPNEKDLERAKEFAKGLKKQGSLRGGVA